MPSTVLLKGTSGNKNYLVYVENDTSISTVKGPGVYDYYNDVEMDVPRWSENEDYALWRAHTDWSVWAFSLIHFEREKELWQIDIKTKFVTEILRKTRQAKRSLYDNIKKNHADFSDFYPDGFTIDVTTDDNASDESKRLKWPLKIRATLTSNPKEISTELNLDSVLQGLITKDGVIKFTKFKLVPPPNNFGGH